MSPEKQRNKKKNKKRNRLIFRTVILAILVGALVFAIVSNYRSDTSIYKAGDLAPDFKLQQINEYNELESIHLSELKGQGVMLNFWGTWCEPCEREMPYMEALYPKYKDKGVEIVAVALDNTEVQIDQFIDKHNLTFPIPHDKTGEVKDLYNIKPIPSTFFINAEGEIEAVVNGALSLESLESYLQDIQPE